MKAKRLVLIAAAFTCILFVLAYQFIFTADLEHARERGERLSIATLLANEEIVVSTLFAHRSARGREYRIQRKDGKLTVAIFDTTPAWARDDGQEGPTLLFVRSLSEAEVDGLGETIAYCREVREEFSSATKHMHLQYFRAGKEIGEEFYIGFTLPLQLAYFAREGMRGNPDFARDYDHLAFQVGVSRQRLDRMISFEMLETEEPNQALQPTPMLVTPRADARVAPSTGVADL